MAMGMNRLFPSFLATVCICAVFTGCRKSADEELVIISPHSPEIRNEFSRGFSVWYAGRTGRTVSLKWLDIGGTGEVIAYIRSRNAEKRQAGGVDIFFGGGDFPYIKLAGDGLLIPYEPPDSILAVIPADINGAPIRGQGSLWYGAAVSGFGIIYNKEICRRNRLPIPSRWEDLARPECRGWVATGDPRYSGSIHMMYEILLQAYGWEKGWEVICRMAANAQTFSKGAASAAKAVSIGQAAFGLAIDFYAFIEIERYGANRLGFVMPEGETVVSADGIAILKNAPSPDVARMFMEYVLGDGQKLWILKKGVEGGPAENALCRFPVNPHLYNRNPAEIAVEGNPFTLASVLRYNSALGGRRWSVLSDLLAANCITPHDELKRWYAAAIRAGMTNEHMRPLFDIGVTEEEAMRLAEKWDRKDFALERIRMVNAWARAASRRYRRLYFD